MSNESTAQIVERIIESLSDAVSQLVVLVIALQEQNAEMPAQLPQAANAVSGAAGTLTQVATALANEEYDEYPDIQQQMLVAVEGVRSSANNMIQAVNNMQTTKDRKAGWERLVDACKVIAGKTILLLQIVYGAELKRLFAAADLADDALNKLDANAAGSAPDDFAAKASDAASKANQFAEYLDSKAQDEVRPDKKKKMQQLADDLRDDAQRLIEKANELLADPDDPKKKKEFEDLLEKLKADMRKARDPVRDDVEQANRNIDNLQNQARGDPNYNALFPAPVSKTKGAEDSLDDDEILAVADRMGDLADRVEHAARRGDPNDTEAALKDLDAARNVLGDKVKNKDKTADPATRKKLASALADLDKNSPDQKTAARGLAKNPTDKQAQDHLDDANRKAKNALEDIADALRPGAGVHRAADDLERDLDDLESAAARGDKDGVDHAARNLDRDRPVLVQRAKDKAAREDDPNRKKDLLDSIGSLERLLPQEVNKAKALAADPKDKRKKQELDDVSDRLRDDLHNLKGGGDPRDPSANARDELEAASNAAKAAADRLRDAARKGDRPGVDKAGNDLHNAVSRAAEPARRAADKEKDPATRQQLLNNIDELERLLPAALKQANNNVAKPNDPAARKGLDDSLDDLLDSLANVQSKHNPEAPALAAAEKTKRKQKDLDDAVGKADPKGIEDAARALDKAADDLQNKANKLAKDRDDPARRKELTNALDDLANLVPAQVKAANRLRDNPRDGKNKKDYDDAAHPARPGVDDVRHAARSGPKEVAQHSNGDLDDDLDRLIAAAGDGDVPRTADTAKDVVDDVARLNNAANREAARATDPAKRKRLGDAVDKVNQLLPDVIRSSKEAALAPKDPRKQKKLADDADKLRKAADDLNHAFADSPEDELAAMANKAARDADKLAEGAKRGNPQAMKTPTGALARNVPEIKKKAAEVGNRSKPDKKKDLNSALNDVEDRFPEHLGAARNVVQDPTNPAKRRDMDDKNDDLTDALRNLAKAAVADNPEVGIRNAHDRVDPASRGVADAARKGDLKALQDPLADLEDAARKLIADGKAAAANTSDPKKRKALEDAVSDLEDLLRHLRPDAERAARNPNDKDAFNKLDDDLKKLKNAADKLADATQSKPLAELEEQERDLDALGTAAKRKDPKGINDAMKNLANRAPKIADAARKEADRDPSKRKGIQDALDDLDRLLAQSLAPAALRVAKNPNDQRAQDDLDDARDRYRDGLKDLGQAMRPSAGDKLANDADRANDALDKVRKAGHDGDPQRTNQALRDLDDPLQDVVSGLKNAARKEDDPKRRKRLEDALNDIDRYTPDVQNRARDAAKNPKDSKAQGALDDAADALGKRLNDVADEASPAHKKKGGKKAGGDADKIASLLPQLEEAANALRKNPNDPAARKRLEDILDQLEDPTSSLADYLSRAEEPTLGEDIARGAKDYTDALDDLEDAARRGDGPALADAARRAAAGQRDLAPKIKQQADRESDPTRRKGLLDALEDLERLLPQNIRAAQNLAKNPKDTASKKPLADTNEDLKRAAKTIRKLADPDPEQAILAAAAKGKDHGAKLKEAVRKGDKKGADEHEQGLEDAANTLADKAREEAARTKDPKTRKDLEDAIKALDDLLNRLAGDVDKAVANPRDAAAVKKVDDDVQEFGDLADKIAALTKAKPIGEGQDEDDIIDSLAAAAKRGDPRAVADATKRLAENNPKFIQDSRNEASKIDDPTRRKNILDSLDELERLLPQTIPAVKNAISNPDDKGKQKELQDILAKYKQPIAKVQDGIKPSNDNQAQALARDADAALDQVAAKAHKGDLPGTQEALKNAKVPIDALKEKARQGIDRAADPATRRSLQDALDALDKLMGDLDKAAVDAARNPNDQNKQDELDDVIHQIKKPIATIADTIKDEAQEEGKKQRRAANVIAALRGAKKRRMDPKSLLEAADELSACLRGMLFDVKKQAYAGGATTEEAGKALALNDLLSDLERTASGNRPAPRKENLSNLLDGLNDLAASAAPPPGASLEQSITWVAQTLEKRNRQIADDPTAKHTSSIAAELAKLAEAVRSGKRSEFLIVARTISALINNYYNEIVQLSKNCKDPVLKDRLIQNGQALKNFSVQLKILASVKAASTGHDDAESQLGVLMQNFGTMLNATINNVQVYRIKAKQ